MSRIITLHILLLTGLISGTAAAADTDADANALYDNYCAACHNLGVAGAPRITDQEAWQPRLAQGNRVLYDHAIQGFNGEVGSMPPKGGFAELSDEQTKIIVEYMISRVQ